MLSIPKSLKVLRWTQNFCCFSIGSCIAPFYDTLGKTLLHYKETLENLELDLRHAPCGAKGHTGNSHAKVEDMIAGVQDTWREGCHLLGSLYVTVLDWNPRFNWPGKEDKEIFKDVVAASTEAGIKFLILKAILRWQTPVP
jgi:hypothetical protein